MAAGIRRREWIDKKPVDPAQKSSTIILPNEPHRLLWSPIVEFSRKAAAATTPFDMWEMLHWPAHSLESYLSGFFRVTVI